MTLPSAAQQLCRNHDKLPSIGKFTERLINTIGGLPTKATEDKLAMVIEYREELHAKERNRLANALRASANRITKFADRLDD